ncbi:MAG TPA: HAD family hydrolase [Solirubrobacteraceae bacterium]|jgi:HAD superfamily hydrolase (TIGR01509 family)|nr:HAD family hydrolase [Solirubrobacteraceae bacterium]
MLLARRLRLPDATRGLLLDLDGVLVDTLGLEAGAVDGILSRHVSGAPAIPFELLRSAFALPVPESWRAILAGLGIEASDALVEALTADLERVRVEGTPEVLPGVAEIVSAALAERLPVAVVSNNPSAHVAAILAATGLGDLGAVVVGNDEGLPSKPAPDMYLEGARRLGLAAGDCAAVEDSLLGARAARLAGCFVVGVATGADDFAVLEASPDVDRAHATFALPAVRLAPGDVTVKRVASPNEFVSHMVEHIAWRAGCEIDLAWPSDDWEGLGAALGAELVPLLDGPDRSWAMGLIDDGSAEVTLERAAAGSVELTGDPPVLDWFLGLRVEQLASGEALVELLRGLAGAAGLRVTVAVGSVDDAHHTWEAVFRGVGLALRELSATLVRHAESGSVERVAAADGYGLRVAASSPEAASVVRTTAESVCSAELRLEPGDFEVSLTTSPSVDARGLRELVALLAAGAGISGGVSFEATKLSSSHVVCEDVGMTLGAAFRELASARMAAHGIEGAGWGVAPSELKLALSWEGRKFLKLLPVGWSDGELKRFRVGTTLRSGLFSEDLDDFLDGFVGGMHASVMVHWPRGVDLDGAWAAVFECLGGALAMALRPNRARRGLIAGVKATLA